MNRKLFAALAITSELAILATAIAIAHDVKAQVVQAPVPLQWNYDLFPQGPDGTTRATYPGFVHLPTLVASSSVCTDANKNLSTSGCSGGGGGAVNPPWTCVDVTTSSTAPYEVNASGTVPAAQCYSITSDGTGAAQAIDFTPITDPLTTAIGTRIIVYFASRASGGDVIDVTVQNFGALPIYGGETFYGNNGWPYTNPASLTSNEGGRLTSVGQAISLIWDGLQWNQDEAFNSFNDATVIQQTNVTIQPNDVDAAGDNASGGGSGEVLIQGGGSFNDSFHPSGVIINGGTAFNSGPNIGGGVTITGGGSTSSSSFLGGTITITGGSGTNETSDVLGSAIHITGGSTTSTTGWGGGVLIQAGSSPNNTSYTSDNINTVQIIGGMSGANAGAASSTVLIQGGIVGAGSDPSAGSVILSTEAAGQGFVIITTLPIADPHVVGAVWNSSGVLHISAG